MEPSREAIKISREKLDISQRSFVNPVAIDAHAEKERERKFVAQCAIISMGFYLKRGTVLSPKRE